MPVYYCPYCDGSHRTPTEACTTSPAVCGGPDRSTTTAGTEWLRATLAAVRAEAAERRRARDVLDAREPE